MSLKSVGIMILILTALYLIINTFGIGIATVVISILFLIQAIVFSIKSEYYDSFLKFMNPQLYNAYSDKNSDFNRKTRKTNIISCYILSAIMGFNAFIQFTSKIDSRNMFNIKGVLVFGVITIGVSFLLNHISILVMKKSKSSNENLVWNIIIGIAISIILIAAGIVYFFISIMD